MCQKKILQEDDCQPAVVYVHSKLYDDITNGMAIMRHTENGLMLHCSSLCFAYDLKASIS